MITMFSFHHKIVYLLSLLFFLLLSAYAIWSFGLTDPNLVLLNSEAFWTFQTWAWQTFFHNKPLQAVVYAVLIGSLFLLYCGLVLVLKRLNYQIASQRQLVVWFGIFVVLISPLFISYNALSHDVFNYIFNARMVVEYQADPHKEVALTFSNDLWTRFMHNTHTPAPYWYGWTVISLLPYILGSNIFLLTWLMFKLFSLASIFLLGLVLFYWSRLLEKRLQVWQYALFFLNPLVLIEIIGNMHNDLWMIVPALASLVIISSSVTKKSIVVSLFLLGLSISIKIATLALVPLWLFVVMFKLKITSSTINNVVKSKTTRIVSFLITPVLTRIQSSVLSQTPILASLLLFVPLVISSRSRWFLPWYLIWSLSLVPLISLIWNRETLVKIELPIVAKITANIRKYSGYWVVFLVSLSLSSLLRYLPWLWYGEYSPIVTRMELLITWIGGITLSIGAVLLMQRRENKTT